MQSEIKIGRQLQLCRETLKRGKTQVEVAADLGISRGYLIAIETNKNQPSYDLLVRLADYYGTTIDFLFGRDEKTMAENEKKVLEYMKRMSEGTRSQFIAIARAMTEEEERWQSYGFGVDAVESLLGRDFIEEVKVRLATLTGELGSTKAAISALRASILAEEFGKDSSQ